MSTVDGKEKDGGCSGCHDKTPGQEPGDDDSGMKKKREKVLPSTEANWACGLCGQTKDEGVRPFTFLYAELGPIVICSHCIWHMQTLIEQDLVAQGSRILEGIIKPKGIQNVLLEHIIGQDDAIQALSVAVWKHSATKAFNSTSTGTREGIRIDRENILFIGPTGVGKTKMAEILAKHMNVPMYIANATTLTAAGYIGNDVEQILTILTTMVEGDIKKAQHGIVVIDEIDKIAAIEDSRKSDPGRAGAQNALLPLLHGTTLNIPQDLTREGKQTLVEFDTSQIMFIGAGAFGNLSEVIAKRAHEKGIGFGGNVTRLSTEELLDLISDKDLEAYGLFPEFVGRLHTIIVLRHLTVEDYEEILLSSASSCMLQYQLLFEMAGFDLEFTQEAIHAIATEALEKHKTGARALRKIISRITEETIAGLEDHPQNVTGFVVDLEAVRTGKLRSVVSDKEAADSTEEDSSDRQACHG